MMKRRFKSAFFLILKFMDVKEELLHWIWSMRRLPLFKMRLVDGREFQVLNFGIYNDLGSGPDFSDGCVLIDGIEWHGAIEIHVKSSDWYKHNHHNDPNYGNVVLHVVLQHDRDVFYNRSNTIIPTIEIGNELETGVIQKYHYFRTNKHSLPCYPMIQELDRIYITSALEKTLLSKYEKRINFWEQKLFTDRQVILWSLAQVFGYPYNRDLFLGLIKNYDSEYIESSEVKTLIDIVAEKHKMTPSDWLAIRNQIICNKRRVDHWKTGGYYPSKSPSYRIEQFIALMRTIDFTGLDRCSTSFLMKDYWKKINAELKEMELGMGKQYLDRILINVIVPFFMWKSKKHGDGSLREEALSLLLEMKSETNKFTKIWWKNGIRPENAFESQGLIEHYKSSCSIKKCLTCSVGTKILSK